MLAIACLDFQQWLFGVGMSPRREEAELLLSSSRLQVANGSCLVPFSVYTWEFATFIDPPF